MPRNQFVVAKKGLVGGKNPILESPHPYKDGSDIYSTVEVPGALGYVIRFSPGKLNDSYVLI
jgi:hypothetical protein